MHKKRIFSLFLAVMFIASIAAPVYALESGKEIYNEDLLFEEATSYDAVVDRFPEVAHLLISKEEVELIQSGTPEGRALQAQYANNTDRAIIGTYEDRVSEVDVMYLNVYDDGTYELYGLRAPSYGTSGGSSVTENGYIKYSNVKVYVKNILFNGNSSNNYGGQMYYYVDYWKEVNGTDRVVKAARNIYAAGSYISESDGMCYTINGSTKTLSKTDSTATGRVNVYYYSVDTGSSGASLYGTVSLKFTANTSGTNVTYSGL